MSGHRSEHTIGGWIADSARSFGPRIAVDDRGVLTTYNTLYERSQALADRFRAAGYGVGSRIATISGSSTDQVVLFIACALRGLTMVPLSWRLTEGELAPLIARVDPALVVVEDDYSSLGAGALRLLGDAAPESAELGMKGIESAIAPSSRGGDTREPRGDDPLLVIFTSGSEAEPKGVTLTHESCFWTNHALSRVMPMTSNDVVLSMLPQFHVAAWNVQPLQAWSVGATVVLERSFQPGRVVQLIRDRGVTHMMGVPTQYRMLFEHCGAVNGDLSSLRIAVVGGATITEQLSHDAARLGIPLYQGYGLTEAGPNVLCLRNEELATHPGTVGRPYPTVETRLTDPATGLPLEGESTGELWVRSPGMFSGYLDDPKATAEAVHDGWLRTGDLVHRDAAGIHRIVDRLKHIYVSGGENVAPAEVEAALGTHPLVERVAVVGVPDEVWGERGFAFVVPKAPLTVDELMAHARAHLAGYKIPAHVRIMTELPLSTLDKVARGVLRQTALDLLAAEPALAHKSHEIPTGGA